MKKFCLAAVAAAAAGSSFAELVPIAPAGGETVPMLSREQIEVSRLETYKERLDYLKPEYLKLDAESRNSPYESVRQGSKWRTYPPFRLKWKATEGETGPWKIEISGDIDFKDAAIYYAENVETEKHKGEPDICRYRIAAPNFLLGKTYYWRVTSNLSCSRDGHGELWKLCKCGENLKSGRHDIASAPATFKTADTPPRWIRVEGRVDNIRDLGGWKTVDGRRVKEGLVFRGQGLNDNSDNGENKGRNRLYLEDVGYLTGKLGIKTDLDLRSSAETADMTASPMGAGVNFVQNSSQSYKGIFTAKGMETMAKNVKLFADEKNYPIYFHCIAGADRTGSLAYVLLGILGVPEHDALVEWEHTFYPKMPDFRKDFSKNYWRREQHLHNGLKKYGGENATFKERSEAYLLDCGVAKEDIEKIRSILLD